MTLPLRWIRRGMPAVMLALLTPAAACAHSPNSSASPATQPIAPIYPGFHRVHDPVNAALVIPDIPKFQSIRHGYLWEYSPEDLLLPSPYFWVPKGGGGPVFAVFMSEYQYRILCKLPPGITAKDMETAITTLPVAVPPGINDKETFQATINPGRDAGEATCLFESLNTSR